jgi:hypothetical protein
MSQTVTVVYDGEVLRPLTPLALEPDRQYRIVVSDDAPDAAGDWSAVESLIGSIELPEDWSAEHDHFLYGSPKSHGISMP